MKLLEICLYLSWKHDPTKKLLLTFETLAPEKVLKAAKNSNYIKLTRMAFHKTNAASVAGTSTGYISRVKTKQEPVTAMRTSNGSIRM